MRPTQESLINTAISVLLNDVLILYTAGTQASRNEEALFLHHLRGPSEWSRVVAAISLHRERLEARDVQDAMARG